MCVSIKARAGTSDVLAQKCHPSLHTGVSINKVQLLSKVTWVKRSETDGCGTKSKMRPFHSLEDKTELKDKRQKLLVVCYKP